MCLVNSKGAATKLSIPTSVCVCLMQISYLLCAACKKRQLLIMSSSDPPSILWSSCAKAPGSLFVASLVALVSCLFQRQVFSDSVILKSNS